MNMKRLRVFFTTCKRKAKEFVVFALCVIVFCLTVFLLWGSGTIQENRWFISSMIPSPIRVVGRVSFRFIQDVPYIHYRFLKSDLPEYEIQVENEDLAFLNSNLPKPTAFVVFNDEFKVSVPAVLTVDNRQYPMRMRYRGDSKSHWLWPQKSMRLSFEDGASFEGMYSLNLIVPVDRQYLVEQFNQYRAKWLGLTVPESKFVTVRINGGSIMVYWEVEQYSKEFLERHGLSGDKNLYGEADKRGSLFESPDKWRKYSENPRQLPNDYTEITKLIDLVSSASDEQFSSNVFSIVDEDNFYSWSVQTVLAGSAHQSWSANMRLYFDTSIGKFRMLPWDVGQGHGVVETGDDAIFEQLSSTLAYRILNNPEFMQRRNKKLWEYVGDADRVAEDLAYYDSLYESTKVAFYNDRVRRFSNRYFDNEVKRYKIIFSGITQYFIDAFTHINTVANAKNENEDTLFILDFSSLAPVTLSGVRIMDDNGDTNGTEVSGTATLGSEKLCSFGWNTELPACSETYVYPSVKGIDLDFLMLSEPDAGQIYKAFRMSPQRMQINLDPYNSKLLSSHAFITIKNEYTGEFSDVRVDVNNIDKKVLL